MASKSKIKGSTYEAKIRDLLSQELKVKFERMPLSGAISYLKGDLWVPEDTASFKFCIECKHYEALDFNNFLTAKSTDILGFWRQTITGASAMKKDPLLIFRWNRSKDHVCWDTDLISTPNMIIYNVFGLKFKMALLADWIIEYKKQFVK